MNTTSRHWPVEAADEISAEVLNAPGETVTRALQGWSHREGAWRENTPLGLQYRPNAAIRCQGEPPHVVVPQAQLWGLLLQYLGQHNDDQRLLGAAREVSAHYGAAVQRTDASLQGAVEAFLPLRGAFKQLAMPIPGIAQPADLAASTDLIARIDRFMDTALLGMLAGFENKRKGRY